MWHSATYISWKSKCALSKVPISMLPNTKTLSMHCSTTVNPHFGSFWGLSSHQTLGAVFPTGMWAAFVTWKLPPSVILSRHLRPLELTEAIPGAAWPSGVVLGSAQATVCVAVGLHSHCCLSAPHTGSTVTHDGAMTQKQMERRPLDMGYYPTCKLKSCYIPWPSMAGS